MLVPFEDSTRVLHYAMPLLVRLGRRALVLDLVGWEFCASSFLCIGAIWIDLLAIFSDPTSRPFPLIMVLFGANAVAEILFVFARAHAAALRQHGVEIERTGIEVLSRRDIHAAPYLGPAVSAVAP